MFRSLVEFENGSHSWGPDFEGLEECKEEARETARDAFRQHCDLGATLSVYTVSHDEPDTHLDPVWYLWKVNDTVKMAHSQFRAVVEKKELFERVMPGRRFHWKTRQHADGKQLMLEVTFEFQTAAAVLDLRPGDWLAMAHTWLIGPKGKVTLLSK